MIKKQPARTNGVERVKSFVNVRLHCNVSNLKKISKISTLLSGKSSADARVCTDFDLILGSQSVVLFGSILLSHSKTINAKVVSFLNLYTKWRNQNLYNFDA